jgi:hypothetical protein
VKVRNAQFLSACTVPLGLSPCNLHIPVRHFDTCQPRVGCCESLDAFDTAHPFPCDCNDIDSIPPPYWAESHRKNTPKILYSAYIREQTTCTTLERKIRPKNNQHFPVPCMAIAPTHPAYPPCPHPDPYPHPGV